jgi:hypothetical protein
MFTLLLELMARLKALLWNIVPQPKEEYKRMPRKGPQMTGRYVQKACCT